MVTLSLTKKVILGWLAICSVGHIVSTPPQPSGAPGTSVRLMRAPLPSALGLVARHYWFAVRVGGEWARWEVWQEAQQNSSSWGHVHKDLMAWNRGVGGGSPELVKEWQGETAERFAACLRDKAPGYSDRDHYQAWPGPNSNTFVDAMLRQCALFWTLDGTGVGKDYRAIVGASLSAGGTGVQAETPLVGVLLGLNEGIQIHLLSLSVGVDFWPPAIISPFGDGRYGFSE